MQWLYDEPFFGQPRIFNEEEEQGSTDADAGAAAADADADAAAVAAAEAAAAAESTAANTPQATKNPRHIGKKRKPSQAINAGAPDHHLKAICARLDLGADPSATNIFGDTQLHCVTTAEMVAVMIESGADINAQNGRWRTPLHCAVALDRVAVCQALVEFGASLSIRDNEEKSPLDYACIHQNDTIVRILATHERANPEDTSDQTGLTALHHAEGKATVDILVDAGASVHTPDSRGKKPLHYLYSKSNITICALLN